MREELAAHGIDLQARRRYAPLYFEQHDQIVDVVFIQSGEGTLVLGGQMIGSKGTGEKGESLGTDIQGGQSFPVAAGDVMHIPAKIPHRYLVPKGKHITYVLFKFPAK